jgi:hypothetical protein
MVQAQIESIQGLGDWKSTYDGSTMYSFEVAFKDGTVGEANSKSSTPPYAVGDTAYYVKNGKTPKGADKLKITKNPPPPGGFKQFQPAKQDPDKDKKMIRGMCFKVAGMAWANQYKHQQFDLPHEVMVKDVIALAKKYEQAFNEWMTE